MKDIFPDKEGGGGAAEEGEEVERGEESDGGAGGGLHGVPPFWGFTYMSFGEGWNRQDWEGNFVRGWDVVEKKVSPLRPR